jgi:hypothetical protein
LVNIQGGGMPEWNYYVNENNVETYIFFDTSNYMFLKYPTWFFENGSGEQSIGQSDLELLISAESGSYFNFDFKNMAENVLPQNRYNISTTIYKNTYFTVSNKYAQDGINLIVKLYNSSNGLLNTFYLNGSPNANVERLIFCEYNCTKVVLQRRIDSETPTTLTTIYPINGCHTLTTNTPNPDIKQLFYSDRNNSLQVFNTTANRFIEEVTTKEYINIGSRKMVNSSTTQRKLHQHTGFNVTEREMYDINKASFVWTVNNDNFVMNEPVMERWMMDNNTFSSYNGTKITEKNVELIMSQERQDTNYSNQKINFYD